MATDRSIRDSGCSIRDVDDCMENWWAAIEQEIVGCLMDHGTMTPAEIGRRLGFSEGAAVSFLCILVRVGKVRIGLVELNDAAPH